MRPCLHRNKRGVLDALSGLGRYCLPLLATLACLSANPAHAQHNGARISQFATAPEDGQWTMPAKDYASTRYSGLAEINRSNVGGLKLAFSFDTQNKRGHEAAPLVVGTMMYIVTPYPNHVWALDLAQGGRPVWVFQPDTPPAAQGVACCDVVNRGGSYWNGRIYFSTLDGEVFAIDAKSGHQVWRAPIGDINKGETVTMAPLVADGKVLVGNSGGEFGVRGWLTALDAATGRLAWRAYSTGPDADVLIGPEFKPFYAMDQGKDLGVKTWPPDGWKTTLKVVRTFAVGWRAWNLALSPDEKRLYTANGLTGDMTAVDLETNEVVGSVALGGKPWGVVAAR